MLASAYTGVAAQWLALISAKRSMGSKQSVGALSIEYGIGYRTALNPTQLSISIIYYNLHIYQALSAEKKRKAMKKAIL